MKTLILSDFLNDDEYVHIARNSHSAGGVRGAPLHSHDFAEVFWIEHGQCIHQINGQTYSLEKGEMVFIRPSDVHAIQLKRRQDVSYINLAFRKEHVDDFSDRLFAGDPTLWTGSGADVYPRHLSDAMLSELAEAVDKVLRAPHSKLMMEWMLCEIFRIIGPSSRSQLDIPEWLQSALAGIKQPEHFRNGATGLSMLAGRTPEHVSRVTKQLLGRTPSQIVNEARVQHASGQLIMTNDDINQIALDVGFLSLGQFYNEFRKAYAMTPRKFRLNHRRIN